jgi:hypothetical protein
MGLDLGGLKPQVLFDRGYPPKDIIRYLEDKGLRYVVRVQKGFNSLVDEKKRGSKEIKVCGRRR